MVLETIPENGSEIIISSFKKLSSFYQRGIDINDKNQLLNA